VLKPDFVVHKEWLANLLMGRQEALLRIPETSTDDLIAEAKTQGVLALATERLQQYVKDESTPSRLAQTARAFSDAAREEVMWSMFLEQGTRQVLKDLERAGIAGLLLKGSALSYWAYGQPHLRRCNDVDLLVASQQAAKQLASDLEISGFKRHQSPLEPVCFELLCSKSIAQDWELEIDIHWQLCNSALFAGRF
jgi:hypothetical protein